MTSLHDYTIGDGPIDVVFLHGLFGQGKNFASVATAIGDLATCHLLDLPNHGKSPWSVEFDLPGQTELIAADLMDRFDHPVTVVGHSLGGKLAMILALQDPQLVERLMVVDISPARNNSASEFADLVAAMRNLDIENLPSRTVADEQLKLSIPNDVTRGFLLQNLRRKGDHWQWAANLDLLGDSLFEIGGWPKTDVTYDAQTWWVIGGKSAYVQPEHLAAMRQSFPHVVTITLKRAGHWVHADEPDGFIATCRAFLGEKETP